MTWEPISEVDLWDRINTGYKRMTPEQKRCWDVIKIMPEKWHEESYGKPGNGFWVVAVIGTSVLWYNDIECGFNRSQYTTYGTIDDYWCNQDELEWAVQAILDLMRSGHDVGGKAGPPPPIVS